MGDAQIIKVPVCPNSFTIDLDALEVHFDRAVKERNIVALGDVTTGGCTHVHNP